MNKKVAVIALLVVVSAATLTMLLCFQGPWQTRSKWFNGAYMNYTISGPLINGFYIVKVVKCNTTHALLLVKSEGEVLGKRKVNVKRMWIPLSKPQNMFLWGSKKYKLLGKHEENVYINNEERKCMVYEYEGNNNVMKIYVDEKTLIPLKVIVRTPIGPVIIKLKNTNIPM